MKKTERPIAGLPSKAISRRNLLQGASAAALAGMMSGVTFADSKGNEKSGMPAVPARADKAKAFPDKFLWGCATAGHQVEGNNTNSDLWAVEHLPESMKICLRRKGRN